MEDRHFMRHTLDECEAKGDEVRYGGWALAGAYRQLWYGEEIPMSIDSPPDGLALIECAFYVAVRPTLTCILDDIDVLYRARIPRSPSLFLWRGARRDQK